MSLQFAANLPKILAAQERAAAASASSSQNQLFPVIPTVYSQVPIYLIIHFLLAHVLTATRPLKVHLGIDHNANPRQDFIKYAEPAAKSGKISERQLRLLSRMQACHENCVENLPVFVGAVIFACLMSEVKFGVLAGVEAGVALDRARSSVNWLCAVYTVARVGYVVAYWGVERGAGSYVRSGAWWVGNVVCALLVLEGGRALNANIE